MKKAKNKPETQVLRVLILEDNPADAELVERELRRAGIVFTSLLTEGKREFKKALKDFQPQIILSDFKLPRFDGLAALEIARHEAPDIPFIFVSGSIGEERAIETLTLGASDYIFKDNLQRLGPAIKREVEAANLKLEKKISNEQLRQQGDELRLLAEAAERFVQINDIDEMYKYLSQVIHDISGADYLLLSLYEENLQAVRPKIITGLEPFREILRRRFHVDPREMVFYLKDMRADDFSDFVSRKLLPVRDGLYGLANRKLPRPICRAIEKLLGINALFTMGFSWENQLYGSLTLMYKKGRELQNHAQIEALLNQAAVAIKRLLAEKSLRKSERMYSTLVGNLPGFVYRCHNDRNWTMEFISEGCREITGYAPEDFIGNRKLAFNDIIRADYQPTLWDEWQEKLKRHEPFENEYPILRSDGEVRWLWERGQGVFAQDDSLLFLEGFITDITQRRQMEDHLRKSEEKYRLIADNTAETITMLDMNLRFTYVSPSIFKLRGYTVEEALNLTLQQSMPPGSLEKIQMVLSEEMALEAGGVANPKRSRTLELQEYHKDGSIIWVENSLSFLRDPQGNAMGFVAVSKDISERKRAEEQIQYQADLLRNVSDAILATDKDGRLRMWNRAAENIYGWKAEDALGSDFHALIDPEYRFQSREEVIGKLDREGSWSGEIIHRLQDGKQIPVHSTITILKDAKGNPAGMVSVNHDISARKQAEQQIYSSLKEKEVLLQEIHHRVKNNLQIISGLLTLQADQSAGKSLAEIFQESQDRIRSIALIHEKLYKSHNLAEIEFDEYLRSLTENLFSTHGVDSGRISIVYKIEKILFTIEKAIPMGLIVNELITNILKHAFPDERRGEIRIGLHAQADARKHAQKTESGTLYRVPTCELVIADNGIGLPSPQMPEQQKTLGMKLVSMLAQQLQAELKVKTGPGTEFHFVFPGMPANKSIKDQCHGG
jgi:PAS domain S-box-containing protein